MRLALWMYEGTAHHGVGRITNSMRGVHAVFHAPQGDDYVTPIFSMLERAREFPQMTTSVVDGRDLARGTIRLPETLKQLEASIAPELFVVCASCSTILLQEDLQTIALSAKTRAPVLVYDANPYRMQEIASAEGLLTTLVRHAAITQPRTEQPSVNIIGPASLGFHVRADLIWLRRALAAMGVQINVIAPLGASLADLARLPAAWATLAPYRELGLGAATYLEEQFGVPALTDAPIGVQPTKRWLMRLAETLGVKLPRPEAFSLDGLSAPSGVPWFARTADMESFSSKKAFVFGDATHTVGIVKFLHDELGMQIAGAGTYLASQAEWVAEQLAGYLPNDDRRPPTADQSTAHNGGLPQRAASLLVTDTFQEVAARIEALGPDLVCGTQMERHSCRKLDLPVMVIAPPTHIENHLLGYRPMLGFDGADALADLVYTTATLGLEKHLIDMFGDAGLEYEAQGGIRGSAAQEQRSMGESAGSYPDSAPKRASASTSSVSASGAPASTASGAPVWSADAQSMLKKIPFFVRGRIQKNVEKYAADHGHAEITADVLLTAKEQLGG